eukprot:CAMPEP_0114551796 /NCGR_PEP_ID=MMETSP0114-20121206/6790_1 /TAXON_ID=31324 /ORGANISM="Goniomonas sp, Strain m" /LENGTH=645 /DNA_ID=CAMNT_0001736645 /DNA_START=49 /DNA_END=1986 /DNA_ORIENTATION=+
MVVYNFKKITVVPTAKDFVDVVLSKTQRKTPTVVHKQYHISRIRSFYMRKVKFTQANFAEKMTTILEEFPRLDDVHPFYADLMNVLYDRDHYKLALGQIATASHLIDRLTKDYIRLLKYGDSLYRCKTLKRAALGRMCTLMRKLNPSLAYLEHVRQHLARLPSIDTNTRTLLVCGYPNVGKSSFMNKVTRANVEVHAYAFTTKSLFVGHTDYKYLPWQVIDTPGILDHDLEDRNTIEMQAVTALAHLRACVMFFLDVSESCGYSIKDQVSLFHSIEPLFEGKPLLLVVNKTDLKRVEDLSPADQALIKGCLKEGTDLIQMSTLSEEGVSDVKTLACEKLLKFRVENKSTKSLDTIANRLTPTLPMPRDQVARPPCIPESVQRTRAAQAAGVVLPKRRTEKDLMLEGGGAGVFSADWKKLYDLKVDEWKYDIIPEIMDGKNIADFVDLDIWERLGEMEREEEEREAAAEAAGEDNMSEDELDEVELAQVAAIRRRKALLKNEAKMAKSSNHPRVPRGTTPKGAAAFDATLEQLGFDEEAPVRKRARSASRSQSVAAEARGRSQEAKKARMAEERERSRTREPKQGEGFKDVEAKAAAEKLNAKTRVRMKAPLRYNKSGEADRKVPTLRPKHLYSGKMSGQKTKLHR